MNHTAKVVHIFFRLRVSSSGVCVDNLNERAALLIEGGPFCFPGMFSAGQEMRVGSQSVCYRAITRHMGSSPISPTNL